MLQKHSWLKHTNVFKFAPVKTVQIMYSHVSFNEEDTLRDAVLGDFNFV